MNNKKKNRIVFSILILILIVISISSVFGKTVSSSPTLILEKSTYSQSDDIYALINATSDELSDLILIVNANDDVYKYFGLSLNKVKITHNTPGNYSITLFDGNGNLMDAKTIIVYADKTASLELNGQLISSFKDAYDLNEKVLIFANITGADVNLEIVSKESKYKYFGVYEENITFMPKFPGVYEARLIRSNKLVSRVEFLVIDSSAEKNAIMVANNNSVGRIIDGEDSNNTNMFNMFNGIKSHNSKGEIKVYSREKFFDNSSKEFIDEIVINDKIKRVKFRNLSDNSPRIGIDTLSSKNVKFENKNVVSAYAIDPSSMNFTTAEVTVTAIGKELYKCIDWSFAESVCLGNWVKLMDLTPGEDYTFNITSADPGFIETGVATINSKKPIYYPNETAEILIAVLDTGGYLVSGANLKIELSSPNNRSYNFTNGAFSSEISEVSKGIYQLFFDETWVVGNYSLFVNATAPGVDYFMYSNFLVDDSFEFDISRDTPMSIDPWKGEFTSTINVTPLINVSNITLIERIPLDFSIVNSTGAKVVNDNFTQNLVWEEISPYAFVSYSAIAPLITPDLKVFQSEIVYLDPITLTLVTFEEARPWYMAIDPTILLNNTDCLEMEYQDPLTWAFSVACQGSGRTDINDGSVESQRTTNTGEYCGIRTGYQYSLVKCDAITNVEVIAEWWFNGGNLGTCEGIWVSADGTGGPWTQIPGSNGDCTTSANAGVIYYNVTSLKSWTCQDFINGEAYLRLAMSANTNNNRNCMEDILIYNITYTQHFTPPIFFNESRNVSSPKKNESVKFNITISDDGNVSSWKFSWNMTGSWVNITSGAGSGVNYSPYFVGNVTINKSRTVCYKWFANDTFDNWNESSTYCFTVANTAPSHSTPKINSSTGQNSTNEDLFCYPQNGWDIDGDTISYFYKWFNDSNIINGETASNLSKTNFVAGQNISCEVTPFDGVINGTSINSTKITILQGADLVVYQTTPVNNSVSTNRNVTFVYSLAGSGTVDICELLVDGISVKNETSELSFYTPLSLDYEFLSDGDYSWIISCSMFGISVNSSSFNIMINNDNSLPIVNLSTPFNSSTVYGPTQIFICNSSDDGDIASVNLYTNRSGIWAFEATQQSFGFRQTNVSSSFILTNLVEGSFAWNCEAIDYDNLKARASANYTVTINLQKPNATLNSPANYWYDLDGNVTFNCTAKDNADIVNVTLYTNAFGSWQAYSTMNATGAQNTTFVPIFNIPNIAEGNTFVWNCLATDNESYTALAPLNYTLTIPPQATPYFANSYGKTTANAWTNPQAVILSPDEVKAVTDIDNDRDIYTYNYSNIPTDGTLLGAYHSFRWNLQNLSLREDDIIIMAYSNDSGSNWYNLNGSNYAPTSMYNSPVSSYHDTPTNQSHLITGPLTISTLLNIHLLARVYQIGAQDNVLTEIDAIWLSVKNSPPPWYTSVSKNDSLVFTNETVMFNSTWNHEIGLGCYVFSINIGTGFVNSSCISMLGKTWNANYTSVINSTPGTVVQWVFYANNTLGVWNYTPIQYFIVSDPNDAISPSINRVDVTPSQNISGTIFNITANITDNIAVVNAVLTITFSNGQNISYNMSSTDSIIWTYFFASSMGGDYSFRITAYDAINNATSNITSFNVTSYLYPFNAFYGRGESLPIVAKGFSSSSSVLMTIKDPAGNVVHSGGISTNANGSINTSWTIPSALTVLLGTYTITLNDTSYIYLNLNSSFFVIKRVDNAIMVDRYNDPGGESAVNQVYDSDDLIISIDGINNNDPQHINMSFEDTILTGYNMTRLLLYVEHVDGDSQNDPTQVYFWNGSAYLFAACNPLAYTTSWVIDVCDLTGNLSRIPDKNNLKFWIDYNDNNDDRGDISYVDFLGIYANWSVGSNLAVNILSPTNVVNEYNYTDTTNNHAYYGNYFRNNDDLPPTSPANPLLGTEASLADYSSIVYDDASRWITNTIVDNNFAYQTFYFRVSQQISDIQSVEFTHDGYVVRGAATADDYYVYAYDLVTREYDQLNFINAYGTPADMTSVSVINSGFSNYINSTTGDIIFFVVSSQRSDGSLSTKSEVRTDFVTLDVMTIPTISGFQDINATAIDGDGVAACQYYFTNLSGYNFTYHIMSNDTIFNFYNTSDTSVYKDGLYNLTVNCTDTGGEKASANMSLKISNTAPSLILISPSNLSNYTSTRTVSFVWNASTLNGVNPICDLYINGAVNVSNIISLNNRNTSKNVTNFADGTHTWKVVCNAPGGTALNTSETRIFFVDLTGPAVTLNTPSLNQYVSTGDVGFFFTPNDLFNISYCDLTVDGVVRNSSSSIIKGVQNNLSYSGISQGSHNWIVNCTDIYNNKGNSTTRMFYVDLTNPFNVTLFNPNHSESFTGSYVQFNFTAFDNMAQTLYCNITINGMIIAGASNIAVANGTPTLKSLDVGDGFKYWNVTCSDSSGRSNTSETRNFTVIGDPTVNLISPNDASSNNPNINFTYHAGHSTGLKNCSLLIDDLFIDNNVTPVNYSNNYFSTVVGVEKNYLWTVLCFANNNAYKQPLNYNFTYDNTTPEITLIYPENYDVFLTGNVGFNFTATDNLDTILKCNLSIDSIVSATNRNFNAINGSITSVLENSLSAGSHSWDVACVDDAGNRFVSETKYFDVGDLPTPFLISPPNNGFSHENVTFTYFINDSSGISSCSLYLNGVFNTTNQSSVNNGANNNIILLGLPEQMLIWNIFCVDGDSQSAFAVQNRTLRIDNNAPVIKYIYPNDTIISNSTVNFKFNITDNNDTSPYCIMYIDGSLNQSFSVTSGVNTTKTVSGIGEGNHNWSLTCRDNASNYNYGETLDFIISFGPIVLLTSPESGYVDVDGGVVLNYTATKGGANITNCSLYVNDVLNQTNSSEIISGENNYFSFSGLSEQIFNWTVVCFDENSASGTDAKRIIHVDWTPISNITLNSPYNFEVLSLTTVVFNFTVFDNLDDVLVCNISFSNSSFDVFYVSVFNSVSKTVNIPGFYAGNFSWNVTCTDGAFVNTSETFNFTISPIPVINLLTPYMNAVLLYSNVNFTYMPQSINPGNLGCQLIFDGVNNVLDASALNGVVNSLYNDSLPEGRHNWTIYCLDDLGYEGTGSPVRNLTIDLTNPSVESNYPNGQFLANSSVIFNITATDNLDNQLVCNITVNGTVKYSNLPATNATPTTQVISGFTDGLFFWNATCADDALRQNTSVSRNFTIAEPPFITLLNPDGNRTNIQTQIFSFTPIDNSGNISMCKLILNGVLNQTNSTINNGSINFISSTISHGFYYWQVNCTDGAGNEGTSQLMRNITIDLVGPNITINSPYEGQIFNSENINFNWTASDDFGSVIYCNLTLDGVVNVTNISSVSGQVKNYTIPNLDYGNHNWSLNCWDSLFNNKTSNTTAFIVNAPDAYIDNARITFNNSNPNLNENITIFANISNIGGVQATNFVIEFYNGLPSAGLLIGNVTINITNGGFTLANISWMITEGYHNLWVLVNPSMSRVELNYSNNNATKNISVLSSNITYPTNNTWTNDLTPDTYFNLTDYSGGLINYTILIDGVSNGQIGQVNDKSNTSLTLSSLSQATHYIIVQAKDSIGRFKNSSRIYINIDATNATVNFLAKNNMWFNATSPNIYFNITDNLDNNLNYSLFVDNSFVYDSNITNATDTNYTTAPLGEGIHNITIQALDEANNMRNYTLIFYVDITNPQLILIAPINNANFTTRNVLLNMSAMDNLALSISCNITLDGVIVQSGNVNNGSYLSYSAINLAEGVHFWNASCYDNATNKNISETRSFNVYIPPTISLVNPANNFWSNNLTNTFYFNASDETGLQNCSLIINGVINASKSVSDLMNNVTNNITSSFNDGVYNWSIACFDNTSFYNYNLTQNRTIYVDTTPPSSAITTLNESWFKTLVPNITFNITDNLSPTLNYTFYVNDVKNTSGQTINPSYGINATINITAPLAHIILIESTDLAGNKYNSTPITIYYDIGLPTITLYAPSDGNITINDTVLFNFSANDLRSPSLDCNLTIDSVVYRNYTNLSTPTGNLVAVIDLLSPGIHYWNVTCVDLAGNVRVSSTRNFSVPKPDLTITSGNITFDNYNAEENENITIFANIYNIGNTGVSDVLVRFYKSDPDNGGVQIGADRTISLLGAYENVTLNMTWQTLIGSTPIYVVVDPPFLTNGTISEANETNNKASVNYSVSLYHTVSGNMSGNMEITNAVYSTLFDWESTEITGDNIIITDYESDLDWFSLLAIGKNITNGSTQNDFAEIDSAFGSTNFSDSINSTYTFSGLPKNAKNFTIFRKQVIDVPIVNSTNSSDFITGIIWDSSDGGNEFNGTQDIAFITEINEETQGYVGIVDFEIKVPALLRKYKTTDMTKVAFYAEIK